MKRASLFLAIFMNLVAGSSCQKSTSNNSGGVDGSGGNVQVSSLGDVQDDLYPLAVRGELKLVTWRLRLITAHTQSSAPGDASWVSNSKDVDLVLRFLGSSQDQLDSTIDKMTFNLVDRPCVSSGIQDRDAAVDLGTDEVCVDYSAFKRFQGDELKNNLIAILIHELGHLQGFNEVEAQRIQYLIYSPQYGAGEASSILLYQDTPYWDMQQRIGRYAVIFDQAIEFLYASDYQGPQKVCELIAEFGPPEISADDNNDFVLYHIPGYMRDLYDQAITYPILQGLPAPCDQMKREDLIKTIYQSAQTFGKLQREFSLYIARNCDTDTCILDFGAYYDGPNVPNRATDNRTLTDEKASVYLGAMGSASSPLSTTRLSSVSCQISDLPNNSLVQFSDSTDLIVGAPSAQDPNQYSIHFTVTQNAGESFVRVTAQNRLVDEALASNQGFFQTTDGFVGFLQQGTTSSVSAKVSVTSAYLGSSVAAWGGNELGYPKVDNYETFTLKCQLQ